MSWAYRGLDFLFPEFHYLPGLENFTPLSFSLLSIKGRKGSERSAIMFKVLSRDNMLWIHKGVFLERDMGLLSNIMTRKNHNMWELRNNFNSENMTVRSSSTSYLQEDKLLKYAGLMVVPSFLNISSHAYLFI